MHIRQDEVCLKHAGRSQHYVTIAIPLHWHKLEVAEQTPVVTEEWKLVRILCSLRAGVSPNNARLA